MQAVSAKHASLAAFVILILSGIGLALDRAFFARGAVAIAAQVTALLLMISARRTFGRRSYHVTADPTPGGVVTSGPYRLIRHPIYTAVLLFVAGGALSHASPTAIALAAAAVSATAVRIAAEERLLSLRYPDYRAYAATTKRVVPFVF
jgi:protein-S-isoprenylcysteine O-methyltransferase Ste14